MKFKLWLAVALLGLAVAPASAQQVSTPTLAAIAGAYNTTAPSITAGKFGLVQVDSTGRLIVSCTNCGAATITGINVNGPFNVTVTNNAAGPVIVSTAGGFGGAGGASNVTVTNTANVSIVNQTYAPQGVTVLNTAAGPAIVSIANTVASPVNVSCTNCGSASISNVTVVNSAASPVLVSIVNQTYAAQNVTVTNATALGAAASAASSPVVIATDQATITVRNALPTQNGWTMILLNGLTTTKTTIKNAAGQLGKIYCYNPNSSVAYVQVFDALTGSVTLGTTSPKNSYGIPATSSAGFALANVGDQFATAIAVAATTTVAGLTAPSTALDCNASYN